MCPNFHCNLTVRFTSNYCSKYSWIIVKLIYSFFYCTFYIGLYKASKCKPHSEITVESGTQLKTVHICSAPAPPSSDIPGQLIVTRLIFFYTYYLWRIFLRAQSNKPDFCCQHYWTTYIWRIFLLARAFVQHHHCNLIKWLRDNLPDFCIARLSGKLSSPNDLEATCCGSRKWLLVK